ncbi:MAG: CPBP family intramembrane glutamic endopeptidase, partial [Pseudomonadota bacterium]
TRGFGFKVLLDIVAHFFFIGGALTILVAVLWPEILFTFPLRQPNIWLIVMAGYPILSVIPQELVYRPLFFHRYGALFQRDTKLAIFANALFFGFAHIVMANPVAVAGTMAISLLFARRYLKSESLWAVWLEHSLYGCLIFTIGLGIYFYTGSAHLR